LKTPGSVPPDWPFGVCAIEKFGIVGDGKLGTAPFTGGPAPPPAETSQMDLSTGMSY